MAGRHPFQSGFMFAVAGVLVLLLALLATLQYRWLNRISEADREQRRVALRTAAARFGEDFDRELARAYVAFRLEAEEARQKNWARYAERVARWQTQSPHPGLIGNLFLLAAEKSDLLTLSRFDAAAGRFVENNWPARLHQLRRQMEDQRKNVLRQTGVFAQVMPPPLLLLKEGIPALTIPAFNFHHLEINESSRALSKPEQAFFGCVVAELDLNYVRQHFLPALAARYFAGQPGGELDYQLFVVNRAAPQSLVYASHTAALNAKAGFDEVTNLLSLRLGLIENFSFDVATPVPAPLNGFLPETVTIAIAPTTAAGLSRPADAMSFSAFETGLWELRLQHRAGSLETVVAQVRRRNLAVSFGILLLLAASVALIALSAQRARRLARQQIEFVAGVSHELRAPVSVVCLTSANLADGLVRDAEQVKHYGVLLQNAGRRLADSIEQVLDFAGAEMLQRPYRLTPLPVETVIEQALAAGQPQLTAAGFAVKTEIFADLPPVNADRQALERALQNLLSNAMKYSNGNRSIELRACAVRGKRGDEVQITVTDHGLGIEAAELGELFDPFKRGAAAVDAQIPGNGLGLYLVKRILAAHGGSVSVRSQPGAGSAFTLHLPAMARQSGPVQASVQETELTYEQAGLADRR